MMIDFAYALWRKSTHSDSEGGNCVEVADLHKVIAVRDSKSPGGPILVFGRAAFGALADEIHAGRHDL
jgi:hypothetical protein